MTQNKKENTHNPPTQNKEEKTHIPHPLPKEKNHIPLGCMLHVFIKRSGFWFLNLLAALFFFGVNSHIMVANVFGNFWKQIFWSVNWKKIAKILEKIAKILKPQFFKKNLGYKYCVFLGEFSLCVEAKTIQCEL
jgi:hypothetical protein